MEATLDASFLKTPLEGWTKASVCPSFHSLDACDDGSKIIINKHAEIDAKICGEGIPGGGSEDKPAGNRVGGIEARRGEAARCAV